MRARNWMAATLAGVLLAGAGAAAAGVRVNLTGSMPIGLWRIAPAGELRRGEVVSVCLPPAVAAEGRTRGYIGKGFCPDGSMPLLKPLGAVPGDVVEVSAAGIAVNGTAAAPPGLEQDGNGKPLRRVAAGRYEVAPGEVWILASHHPASWDSRYFGPVPATGINGTASPLLVGD